jgi:hypothetical protein
MMLPVDLLLAAEEVSNVQGAPDSLTTAGWTVMILSVGAVLGLVTYCLFRVLTLPPIDQESLKGPLEIDTGDTVDAD